MKTLWTVKAIENGAWVIIGLLGNRKAANQCVIDYCHNHNEHVYNVEVLPTDKVINITVWF